MRHINEYFSESEKVSLISEYLLSKKHTKTNTGFLNINEGDIKTKKKVIDFFEEKNFKRVYATYVYEFFEEFENSNQPVYWVGKFDSPDSSWVRFGKGGYMSKANPVIFWRLIETKNAITYLYETSRKQNSCKLDTFNEFKDYVNKIFENE